VSNGFVFFCCRPAQCLDGLIPEEIAPILGCGDAQWRDANGFLENTMPIYEFECAACGNRFDRLQKLSDPDPTVCPGCGAERVSRRMTAPAFRLSGSGWYETDFKKDGDKKRNLVGKDEAPKSGTDAPAKTDAAKPVAESAKPAPAKAAKESPGN
jgi:putative FmdB family regulatory protein